jgi:hypothetical protein
LDAVLGDEGVEHVDLEAFGRARAASAVFYSGEPDARLAALEALYEASAVVEDLNELRAAVVPAMS